MSEQALGDASGRPHAPRFPWKLWLLGPLNQCVIMLVVLVVRGGGLGTACFLEFLGLLLLLSPLGLIVNLFKYQGHHKTAASWLLVVYYFGSVAVVSLGGPPQLLVALCVVVTVLMPVVGMRGSLRGAPSS